MHAVAEILLPPGTKDIKAAIDQVMNFFCNATEDDDGKETIGECDWWDYWQIGGRWSGNKTKATIPQERLDEFCAELNRRGVTVSGFTAGKQELNPPSQIPEVDALWREWFPGAGEQCQIFAHSGNRGDIIDGNICTVADVPDNLTAERLILAGPHWDAASHPNDLEATDMIVTEYWNRCRHQKTDWDGNVAEGIRRFVAKGTEEAECYKARKTERGEEIDEEWVARKERKIPGPNWLVVTVDYHN